MSKAQLKPPEAGGPLFQAARQFHAAATAHTVQGTLEHRAEAYDFAFALEQLAQGVDARIAHYGQDAVKPEYQQAVAQIAGMIRTAADAAKRLGPAFDDLHRFEIMRLLYPRTGEQKWDTTANGNGRG